jgi:hypothetical protein
VVLDNLARGHRDAVAPSRLRVIDLHDNEGLVCGFSRRSRALL